MKLGTQNPEVRIQLFIVHSSLFIVARSASRRVGCVRIVACSRSLLLDSSIINDQSSFSSAPTLGRRCAFVSNFRVILGRRIAVSPCADSSKKNLRLWDFGQGVLRFCVEVAALTALHKITYDPLVPMRTSGNRLCSLFMVHRGLKKGRVRYFAPISCFEHWNLAFRICLGFRASDFGFLLHVPR